MDINVNSSGGEKTELRKRFHCMIQLEKGNTKSRRPRWRVKKIWWHVRPSGDDDDASFFRNNAAVVVL